MQKLVDILASIYGQVSDAVAVYSDKNKLIYQNESCTQMDIDTIDINNTKRKVSTSFLKILRYKLKVVIISSAPKEINLGIAEQIKNILLRTSVSDKSFYPQIGELIQNQLQLSNLQITIHDQKQKALVNKYFSNDLLKLANADNKTRYITFVAWLIAAQEQKSIYSMDEVNASFQQPLSSKYLFVPIKSKNNIIGCIGVFLNDDVDSTKCQKSLESIAEYVSIFYGYQHLEETLLQQTSRLNAIFENSSDLIWSVDRTMEIVSSNQNYFRAIFYKYQGGIVTEYLKNRTSNTSLFDEFWEAKYQKVFKGDSLNFEIELKHPNNDPVWKEIFLMPIFNTDGNIEEIFGIAKDISDKKKTVTALHREGKKFKQIFNSFQDLYVRVDFSGKINMISPSVMSMIGYLPSEVMGKDVSDYYLYSVCTKDFFKKIIEAKTLRNIEIRLVGKQGKIIPCICNLRVIFDDNQRPIAIEGICRDITEIKETNEALISAKESLEISLKAKEQFLVNIGHEIRTPMNAIIGLLDMVLDTQLSDKQDKYLSTIKESSEMLLNLLNDILDLSKMNANKLKINKQPLSIHKLLSNIKTLFASEIKKKRLDFKIYIDDGIPNYVKSDKMKFLQILSNLVSNAIKFTPESGSITIKANYQEPFTVKVNVIDTGIGIEEKNIKKLFRNFTQINDSYSKQYSGAGLGLAISKDLAKLLKGSIGVSSVYKKGSNFWFTFKANPVSSNLLEKEEIGINSPEKIKDSDHIKTILVVDDNPTNRLVACEILQKYGLLTDNIDNAETAIEMAKNKSYDIILMDIQMPKMDGIEGMNHIKKTSPHQEIIAMTAYDEKNQLGQFMEMGFDGYLAKPITPKTLMETIYGLEIPNKALTKSIPQSYNYEAIHTLTQYADLETMTDIFHQFEESLMVKIDKIKSANNHKEFTAIGSHAHSIKGDASTLGFELISSQASKIEKKIDEEYFSVLDEDLKTLYLMLVQVPNLIKEILNRLSHEYKNINC